MVKKMRPAKQEEREAAAARAQEAGLPQNALSAYLNNGVQAQMDPLGVPDYFGTIPNYASSPLPTMASPNTGSHYWPWYDGASMRDWVLMAAPDNGSFMQFDLSIAGTAKTLPDAFGIGRGVVRGGGMLTYEEPGLVGGPVQVSTSVGGSRGIVSQRVLMGDSFEEIPSSESSKLSDHFYWTWYDEQSAGFQNWVIVHNPSATETVHAVLTYTDAGTGLPATLGQSDILPGQSWEPRFPGMMGGPLELKAYLSTGSWPADARNVIATQRVISNFGTAFNENPGVPASELATDYLWTWYDMMSPGFSDWILIANPDPVNAVNYEIKIGGVTVDAGSIAAGDIITPTFPGQMDGPVRVTTTATGTGDGKVIASQRTLAGPSFGEVHGYPLSRLSRTYEWAWYDMQTPGVSNWILISNTDPANQVGYSIKIGGVVQPCPSPGGCVIPAGGKVTPTFPGQMSGPVEVAASGPVLASQRVLWKGHFNEVVGMGGAIVNTGMRKFVDILPGVGSTKANNLGQYIPQAIPAPCPVGAPDSCDYYEISLVEYTEKMHTDLPATKLRGYVQTNTTDPTVSVPHYLGPMIVAQKNKPVRVKFTNALPTGAGGNLFLPTDKTIMGAGEGPLHADGSPCDPETEACAEYTQNRATLHLHGGATPWISDGTPHQWITPATEMTPYPEGVSVQNVPDMADPGPGAQTFYYTNQQSARLMFYHDHSFGITRLNFYAGELAPYLLTDPVEQQLVTDNIIPSDQIPLVIQDKTFVPDEPQLAAQDPTWDVAGWGGKGSLWAPHVYMPAQNPTDPGGMSAMGRWHYGPWFWPPVNIPYGPVANPLYDCGPGGSCTRPWENATMPGTPNPSWGAESFMDVAVVNGTAFPTLTVDPKAYRFRILNAANDRFWNLQLYRARANDPDAVNPATGRAALNEMSGDVAMVPAVHTAGFPDTWPVDGREGGVPDPSTKGPDMIQIANESGFLPAPVVHANQPIDWNLDPTTFNFGNVSSKNLLLGTAERADVIIDFSQFAGQTLILYNDAPTAFPALDARGDYFTGALDKTDTGGAPSAISGYGPNTRTIMQIKVESGTPAAPFDLNALNAAFASTGSTTGAYAASQDPVLVPQSGYNSAYNANYPDNHGSTFDTSITFTPQGAGAPITIPFEPKAIQDEMGETFDDYGRMSANLGLSVPFAQPNQRTFVLEGFQDPATEVIRMNATPMAPAAGDGTQVWMITHNGVDTHTLHFHLHSVQLINRVAWDGAVSLPDPNELGWKETLRVNPLENTIVALRPVIPTLPFAVPESVRPLNPSLPIGSTMSFGSFDPNTGNPLPAPMTNQLFNFGWEYVMHCHLLAHEENNMMRPTVLTPVVKWPGGLSVVVVPGSPSTANLSWTDNATTENGFIVQQSEDSDKGPWSTLAILPPAAGSGSTVNYTDPNANSFAGTRYYRVFALNTPGAPSTADVMPMASMVFTNVASGNLP